MALGTHLEAKPILSVLKYDILDTVGTTQLCAGQVAGVEAAVHSVRNLFKNSEAVLLVNSLNRTTAMYLLSIYLALATPVINCYRNPSNLFIDGEVIKSKEGPTRDDPLSMPFYALRIIPLINRLPRNAKQIWYEDDATTVGSVTALKEWWDALNSSGLCFGYYINSSKTWLVTKAEHYNTAIRVFEGTNVEITEQGRPHLEAPIGTDKYIEQFVKEKVDQWLDELKILSQIVTTQLHAAYAALTHGGSPANGCTYYGQSPT